MFDSKNLGAKPTYRPGSSLGSQDYGNKKLTVRYQSLTLNHGYNRII